MTIQTEADKINSNNAAAELLFRQVKSAVMAQRGNPRLASEAPSGAHNHHRVGGKMMSAAWFLGIHNAGFRITWWDNMLGLTEMYAWNHNESLWVMNAAITTRLPDFSACEIMLKLVRLVDDDGQGTAVVAAGS